MAATIAAQVVINDRQCSGGEKQVFIIPANNEQSDPFWRNLGLLNLNNVRAPIGATASTGQKCPESGVWQGVEHFQQPLL